MMIVAFIVGAVIYGIGVLTGAAIIETHTKRILERDD